MTDRETTRPRGALTNVRNGKRRRLRNEPLTPKMQFRFLSRTRDELNGFGEMAREAPVSLGISKKRILLQLKIPSPNSAPDTCAVDSLEKKRAIYSSRDTRRGGGECEIRK